MADEAPPATEPRYLDAVSDLLAAEPAAVQPHLTHWFGDDRPLPATSDATVATARPGAPGHPPAPRLDRPDRGDGRERARARRDELLAVLAEEVTVRRAVDRWAHDERPERRAAAVAYGPRAEPHARTDADRELPRQAAPALFAHPRPPLAHGCPAGLVHWSTVVGPSTRRMIENPAAVRVPA
ncbi:hypothetical protein [Streptomyces sp. 2A115]|uniref:hypothetical protein n=1 Tax=Streptomyces sp. 2A115 TaxID=3457439 RepID=UPI003FD22065